MFSRNIFSAFRSSTRSVFNLTSNTIENVAKPKLVQHAFGSSKNYSTALLQNIPQQPQRILLCNPSLIQTSNAVNSRTVIKFSMRKGKRKAVKTVLKRFYRLHWGGWVRTIAGRHRRMWSKSPKRQARIKQHVLCNATQSTLLDKMVTNYWRKPKYYVDDPYEPYHSREECVFTYKNPKPYYPPK